MKFLGKIWNGIKWGLGKVWGAVKWVGGKIWGVAKGAYRWVHKQPAWKIALVGLAGVAAVVIASKLAKGGNDMDLYGQGGGGSGIATAAKVVGGTLAIGAGAELGVRAVKGVLGKKKKSGSSPTPATSPAPGTSPTPVTDVTLPGASNPGAKPPTSPQTYTLANGEQSQEQAKAPSVDAVSDLDLNISDSEIKELEGELDQFQASKGGPQGLGFTEQLKAQPVGAQ